MGRILKNDYIYLTQKKDGFVNREKLLERTHSFFICCFVFLLAYSRDCRLSGMLKISETMVPAEAEEVVYAGKPTCGKRITARDFEAKK